MGSTFRHKHLYIFHKFWDVNGDGVLTWDDFKLLAEKYTKIQRRGKLDKEVLDRWLSILGKWWDELTEHADFNKDTVVEFDEWLKFFRNLGKQTKSHKELPDFLQLYLHLFFLIMDTNKDCLFCIKDYKKYLTAHNMDVARAQECFATMLKNQQLSLYIAHAALRIWTSILGTIPQQRIRLSCTIDTMKLFCNHPPPHRDTHIQEEDKANGNAFSSDRFRDLVYDFWVSEDPNSPGNYICGPFDSAILDELEKMTGKK